MKLFHFQFLLTERKHIEKWFKKLAVSFHWFKYFLYKIKTLGSRLFVRSIGERVREAGFLPHSP